MGPKFTKIALVAGGKVLVEGPFETHGEVIDDVVVRFLIIEDEKPDAIAGTATLPKSEVTKSGTGDDAISRGTFSATVAAQGLEKDATVRAIGILVAVKRADHPDPPAFETFTWCVKFKVADERGQAS
jgi:hypothetical protein